MLDIVPALESRSHEGWYTEAGEIVGEDDEGTAICVGDAVWVKREGARRAAVVLEGDPDDGELTLRTTDGATWEAMACECELASGAYSNAMLAAA